MAEPRKLSWTEDQLKIRALLEQGQSPKQCREAGFKKNTVSRVDQALKAEKEREKGSPPGEKLGKGAPGSPLSPPGSHTVVSSLKTDPVVVGRMVIEPSDWYINQYGGFLILNTYEHARRTYGYSGTVGDFVCDACQVMRKVMGLDLVSCEYLVKEDDNGRRESGDEGGSVLSEAGDEGSREAAGQE